MTDRPTNHPPPRRTDMEFCSNKGQCTVLRDKVDKAVKNCSLSHFTNQDIDMIYIISPLGPGHPLTKANIFFRINKKYPNHSIDFSWLSMFFCWNTLTPKRRISLWNFNWTWTAVQNSLQVLSVFVNMWASISITGVLPPSLTPCSSVRPIPMFGPSRHTQKPFCLIQSSIQGSIYLSKFGNENNNCVLWKTDKFRNFLVIQLINIDSIDTWSHIVNIIRWKMHNLSIYVCCVRRHLRRGGGILSFISVYNTLWHSSNHLDK